MISITNLIIDRVQILNRILTDEKEHNSLYDRLVKNSVGTFGIMVAGTGLSLIVVFCLARILGAKGYGAYTFAKSCVCILSVPAVLGLEQLIVRKMAAYRVQSKWGLIRGLLFKANQIALLASLGLAFLGAVASLALINRFDPQMISTFQVSLILVPLSAFISIRYAALHGLNQIIVGQIPMVLINPLLFILLIGGGYLLMGKDITASWTMGLNVVSFSVIFVIITMLLRNRLPQAVREASPDYQTSAWMRHALPLLFVSGMYIIISGTDIIMLGMIKGAEPVGTYAIAKRGSRLIGFVMIAVNTALAPTISSLYARGDIHQLQSVVTKSIRAVLLISLPLATVLIVFGNQFLQIFGRDFVNGQVTLAILSIGQLINVIIGSVGLLLVMTGHEKEAAIGVGISMIFNIILNAILIPRWGLNGAAVATTCSMILLNVLLVIQVNNRLGINSTILGRFSFQGEKSKL